MVCSRNIDSGMTEMAGDGVSNKEWCLCLVSHKIKQSKSLMAKTSLMDYIP